MNIISTQVIFVHDRNTDIRRRVFKDEDILSDMFTLPFNQIAVPNEIFPELPRFEAVSKKKFSQYSVSQTRTTFSTSYSEEFSKNIDHILKYLNERIPLIKEASKDEKIQYCGFICEMHFQIDGDVNDYLRKEANIKFSNEKMRDFSLYYSFPYDNDRFINIKITKSKLDEVQFDDKSQQLVKTGNTLKGINVILDMNTKLAYMNEKTNSINDIDSLEQAVFSFVKNKNCNDFLNGEILND